MVARLSDRLTFFGEVTATPQSGGFSVEAERAFVRYDFADYFKLSAGRYHIPVGYWNAVFHHGTWLQTTIARPEMIRFGGSFVPIHFVGVMAEGTVAQESFSLGYSLGVGNGRHHHVARAGDTGDANDSRAFLATSSLRLPGLADMQVGAGYYVDRVTPDDAFDLDERIVSLYVARERETPEILFEYTRVMHDPRTESVEATHSDGVYGQIGYRLPGWAYRFKPYVRMERVSTSADDVLYAPLRLDYEGAIGGIRVDIAPTAALKLEVRSERFAREARVGTVAAQISFTFPRMTGEAEVGTDLVGPEVEEGGSGDAEHP